MRGHHRRCPAVGASSFWGACWSASAPGLGPDARQVTVSAALRGCPRARWPRPRSSWQQPSSWSSSPGTCSEGSMRDTLVGLFCGLIFGFGLLISGMMQPTKVLGFLDLFGGAWDPSLAVVMAAALVVATSGYALARRHGRPLLAAKSNWPTA